MNMPSGRAASRRGLCFAQLTVDTPEHEDTGDEETFPFVGNEITWLAYFLSLDFYPAIKMPRSNGALLAAKLADAMEIERVELESNEWRFGGGGTCDGMQVVVERQRISLAANSPRNAEDFYTGRNALILNVFGTVFSPGLILQSRAKAAGLLDVNGDARTFIGGRLMFFHPKKLEAIDRPLHILGVRMYFPSSGDVDWGVDVRAESWIDDASKLFLEADADWSDTRDWEAEEIRRTVDSIFHVTNFMNTRLMNFLHQSPALGLDDEGVDDDNQNS